MIDSIGLIPVVDFMFDFMLDFSRCFQLLVSVFDVMFDFGVDSSC